MPQILNDTYHDLTTPLTWLHFLLDTLLLDNPFFSPRPTWRHLLLDNIFYLTIDTSWYFVILDGTYYLIIFMTWRHLLLNNNFFFQHLLVNKTYWLTTLATWRKVVFAIIWQKVIFNIIYDPIIPIIFNNIYYLMNFFKRYWVFNNTISSLFRKLLNLNFVGLR